MTDEAFDKALTETRTEYREALDRLAAVEPLDNLLGMDVIPNRHMPEPRPPKPGEWARRYVRNELVARVGEHLAGKPGPLPDDPVATAYIVGNTVIGHPKAVRILFALPQQRGGYA